MTWAGSERTHRGLVVWQRAMELASEVRGICKKLPSRERFELASQLLRASTSVPANIAEGNGRRSPGDHLRFLAIARGSLMELDTHLEIALRAGYLSERDLARIWPLLDATSLLLTRLSRSLSPTRR